MLNLKKNVSKTLNKRLVISGARAEHAQSVNAIDPFQPDGQRQFTAELLAEPQRQRQSGADHNSRRQQRRRVPQQQQQQPTSAPVPIAGKIPRWRFHAERRVQRRC